MRLSPEQTAIFSGLLLFSALTVSLAYNGIHLQYFAVAIALLLAAMTKGLLESHRDGITFPVTALTLCLLLFWGWQGLSIFWSVTPYISVIMFWWLGALPLAFLSWMLFPSTQRWQALFFFIQCLGLGLAVYALYQNLYLHTDPRSVFLNRNSHAAFLNLIALAGMGTLLHALAARRTNALWHGTVLFILALAVFLTGSRGATLVLIIGSLIVLRPHRQILPTHAPLMVVLLMVGAYATSHFGFVAGASNIDRLLSLYSPGSAGLSRFVIWEAGWRMFLDAPWLGWGAGTFWLAFPPYRHARDTSAGFYVHNDYLQLAIETGLIGLLLFLIFLIAVLLLYVRKRHIKHETSALFAALAATAMHSFFTFNLYVFPIALLAGLILGRLHQLVYTEAPTASWRLHPSQYFRLQPYRLIVTLGSAVPLLYLLSVGLAFHFSVQARQLLNQGQYRQALTTLKQAQRYGPDIHVSLMEEARIYTALLEHDREMTTNQRTTLYREALHLLDKAQSNNPLSPRSYFLRARLHLTIPAPAQDEWKTKAGYFYTESLRVDPLFYPARVAYARLLLTDSKAAEALAMLEAGSHYPYPPSVAVLRYYHLLAEQNRAAGNVKRTAQIEARYQALAAQLIAIGILVEKENMPLTNAGEGTHKNLPRSK